MKTETWSSLIKFSCVNQLTEQVFSVTSSYGLIDVLRNKVHSHYKGDNCWGLVELWGHEYLRHLHLSVN